MKFISKATILIPLLSLSMSSYAVDDQKFCKKIQSCMYEEMQKEGMADDMIKAMKPMIDGMCSSMSQKFDEVPSGKEAEVKACIDAMAAASCDALMNNPESIPECARLK